jgi:hypothetical protein
LNLNETWIFSPHFRKTPKYQISTKSFQWEPSYCSDREVDGHDVANSRFSQFCESALKDIRVIMKVAKYKTHF